jgi:hypothetical protein
MESRFFEMSDEYQSLIHEVMKSDAPGLATLGLNFKFLGVVKQPTVIKVTKANPVTEYLTDEDQICVISIYEKAFEMLTDEYKKLIIAHALTSIEYDSEKDKLSITDGGSTITEGVYIKYKEPAVLAVFAGKHAIRQIIEEEKAAKEALAAEKAAKRAAKKN